MSDTVSNQRLLIRILKSLQKPSDEERNAAVRHANSADILYNADLSDYVKRVVDGKNNPNSEDVFNELKRRLDVKELNDEDFLELDLSRFKFSSMPLTNIRFHQVYGSTVYFEHAKLNDVTYKIKSGEKTVLKCRHAKINNCVFEGVFDGSDFVDCELNGCEFRNSSLRDADFERAKLDQCKFENVQFDERTRFNNLVSCKGLTIQKNALQYLGEKFGGLTTGNRMDMVIEDDVAVLRQKFSGLWAWIHYIGLFVFLFPYVWFIGMELFKLRWNDVEVDGPSVTLIEAFYRFAVRGPEQWKTGIAPNIAIVLPAFLYVVLNVCRFALLWKTKELENEQNIKELPVDFSLSQHPWWKLAYDYMNIISIFAILMAILNAIVFGLIKIPL